MFLANKLNKGAGSPAPAADAQFNYVTMLLHGDGTNGAQNNTFLDSSTNNFTITRNGNTTQGSFSPYGSNWSNYFAGAVGSPDYITIPSTTNLNLTGDYTVECWYLQNSIPNPTAYGLIFGTTLGAVGVTEVSFFIDYPGTGFNWGSLNSGVSPVAGTWYHLAATKSGSTTRIFVNGVLAASSTTADTPPSGVNWYIGSRPTGSAGGVYSISGYVSNCRIVKGTALYTSSFTPSTTPLTAVSGTQLLTCQSNRFVDNSANSYALTLTNSPKVQRFNPFGASTAYSTSVIGGSGYFDGAGDSLQAPSGASISGTGDFTAECWIYPTTVPGSYNVIACSDTNTGLTMFGLYNNGTIFMGRSLVDVQATTSNSVNYNAWNYLAITRSSGTLRLFINGVQGFSGSITTSYNSGTVRFGTDGGGSSLPYTGYISNFRINPTTAIYTSGFTPPTAPTTAISGTSLLLNMTNGAIFDNAMMNNLETVGAAQISTSVKKYGTGSMYVNGQGNEIICNTNKANISFGTGDFTIECWMYTGSSSGQNMLWSFDWFTGVGGWAFYLETYLGSGLVFHDGTGQNKASWTWSTNTWYHLVACRSGTSLRLFVDGTQLGSTFTNSTSVNALYDNVKIGSNNETYTIGFTGYIDDLRITKGYARYTANFTPPTAAFPNTGPY